MEIIFAGPRDHRKVNRDIRIERAQKPFNDLKKKGGGYTPLNSKKSSTKPVTQLIGNPNGTKEWLA